MERLGGASHMECKADENGRVIGATALFVPVTDLVFDADRTLPESQGYSTSEPQPGPQEDIKDPMDPMVHTGCAASTRTPAPTSSSPRASEYDKEEARGAKRKRIS